MTGCEPVAMSREPTAPQPSGSDQPLGEHVPPAGRLRDPQQHRAEHEEMPTEGLWQRQEEDAPRARAPTMKQHFPLLTAHSRSMEQLGLWLFMEPGSHG